jgi:hypothetical protein
MLIAVRYDFYQHFAISAHKAYQWCTDFTHEDHALMGEDKIERQVTHLTDTTVILKETLHTNERNVEKQKLVQLYPNRLCWISTHLTGPNKYSQFIYEVTAEGKSASRLNFTALHIQHEATPKENVDLLAEKLCNYDSNVWKLLAQAMEKEFNKKNSKGSDFLKDQKKVNLKTTTSL